VSVSRRAAQTIGIRVSVFVCYLPF